MLNGAVRSVILDSSLFDGGRRNTWLYGGRGPTNILSEKLLQVAGHFLPAVERIEIRLEDSVLRQEDANKRVYGLVPRAVMLSERGASDPTSFTAIIRKYADSYPRLAEAKVRDLQLEKALWRVEQDQNAEEVDDEWADFPQIWAWRMHSMALELRKRAITAQLIDLAQVNEAMEQAVQEMKERPGARWDCK